MQRVLRALGRDPGAHDGRKSRGQQPRKRSSKPRRVKSHRFSITEFRANLVIEGEEDEKEPPTLKELIRDQVTMRAVRKRVWWRTRNWLDAKGFPQEISKEEYDEVRKANPKKFAKDYPSVLWQETHARKVKSDRIQEERRVANKEKRARLRAKKLHAQQLDMHLKMHAYRDEVKRQMDEDDRNLQETLIMDRVKVERLEVAEQEKASRGVLARAAAAKEEQARLKKAEESRRAHDLETKRIQRKQQEELERQQADETRTLLLRSGTVSCDKTEVTIKRPPGKLVVRFSPVADNEDTTLAAYNVMPIAEYSKRFQSANDQARKFPQFFSPHSTDISALSLGEDGGKCLGIVLAVGCFPRAERLSLNFADVRFRGICAISKGLALGAYVRLSHLALNSNNLGDQSVAVLATMLSQGSSVLPNLNRLDLESNRIGCDGARALGHMLVTLAGDSMPLTTLSLSCNRIRDAGARALGSAGRTNPTLEAIFLRSNYLSARAARTLALHSPCLQT